MSRVRKLSPAQSGLVFLAALGLGVIHGCVGHAPRPGDPTRVTAERSEAVALAPESVLTVLVRSDRGGSPALRAERQLDRDIAWGLEERTGKRTRFVVEDDEERMVRMLLMGTVDVVAAHLPLSPELCEFVGFSLPYAMADGFRPVAIAVRPEDHRLLRLANEVLIARALIGLGHEPHDDDLDGIRERGELRILTQRGPATYFVHGGEELGFEYDLMSRFADRHGLAVKMVVPPNPGDLVPWLLQGRGDVIAAGFAVTPERADNVAFTRPYQNAHEVIVVRDGDVVRDLDDLRGRTIYVHESSAQAETLRELRHYEDDFGIEIVSDSLSFDRILDFVEDGTWDATVCDSHVLEMERAAGRRLGPAFPIKAVRHAWAVRPHSENLRASLDDFLRDEYRGLHFNVLRQRYFENPETIAALRGDFRSDVSGRISPYDDLIRCYAQEYGLDWRLVAAQMYEESRFDRDRISPAGAAGLMQLMPSTAAELGLDARHDPEGSIGAGTRYLSELIERFDPELPLETRIRFALASYNAGRGHVQDARRLAVRLGWSADRWYGSVDKALLLLQRPEYYKKSRHGYVRGRETVRYVTEIDRRYRAYVEHIPAAMAAANEGPPPTL